MEWASHTLLAKPGSDCGRTSRICRNSGEHNMGIEPLSGEVPTKQHTCTPTEMIATPTTPAVIRLVLVVFTLYYMLIVHFRLEDPVGVAGHPRRVRGGLSPQALKMVNTTGGKQQRCDGLRPGGHEKTCDSDDGVAAAKMVLRKLTMKRLDSAIRTILGTVNG